MWVVPFISTSLTYDLLQVYIYIYIFFEMWCNITSYSTHSQWILQSTWTPYVTSICITNACPTSYLVSWTSSRMPQLHGIQRGDSICFFSLSPWTPERFGVAERVPGCPSPPNRWSAGLLGSFHGVMTRNSVPTCPILKEATATNKRGWIYLIR